MSPDGVLQNTPASLHVVMLNLELLLLLPEGDAFKEIPFSKLHWVATSALKQHIFVVLHHHYPPSKVKAFDQKEK